MKKLFDILEFDKIKELILKHNINQLSRKKVNELKPLFFEEIVQESIDQTKEAYKLVTLGTFPSLGQLSDVTSYLDKVHKNGVLTLEEIYEFVTSLEVVNSCKQFILNNKLNPEEFIYTYKYINALNPINTLLEQIKYCVSPNFVLYDHASAKLKQIRNSIKKCESEIKEKLNSFLKKNSSLLSDNYIATRGNHYVLPVKAANKSQVKGIVIDVSATANTVFIEPYAVTENNIMLEQLHYEEELEIQRIIKALCVMIDKYYEQLLLNNDCLAELSFMILKGTYGLANDYEVATINENNEIRLVGAFHPLIERNKVIANDFYLGGQNNRIIVISGPNAGGKTVALKTIALLVLMNQCGLPLPVKEASLAIFRNIFVDIGDEQSIEQSLSGFSSHMKNVSSILSKIDSHSLVIMDELGSKTDPLEGEALAKAIIEYIESKKSIAMVTTHYLGIKDYAKENSQITLASMGFNEETLMPTYKLQLNLVGRSYALEISSRLGLNESIIKRAKEFKSNRSNDLDAIIDELTLKLKKENEYVESLKEKEEALKQKLIEVEKEKEKLKKDYEKALDDVNDKKQEMLEEAYLEIQTIVDEFKKANQQEGYKHHLKNKAIEKLDSMSSKEELEKRSNKEIHIGDTVKIVSLNKIAEVKDIKGNKCVVVSSNNTMRIDISELEKVEPVKMSSIAKKKVKVAAIESMSKNIPMSLNLIGMRVEEALIALKNYIDAALLVRYEQVNIIHGFGTGALRKAVHEFLKSSKYVVEYRLGGFNEGGAGATIVVLKKK